MKQETISIESPEKIRFEYKIAQTGARIGAYVIDMTIQVLIVLLLVLLVYSISGFSRFDNMFSVRSGSDFQLLATAFLFLVIFFFQWGYFTFFELFRNGQSPGKKALRIRVIKAGGEPLDASSVVLRNLLRAVDGFPGFHLLGGIISIVDKKSRRLGDIVADCLVVHDILFDLEVPDFKTTLSTASSSKPALALSWKLNEEELYVIRRFLNGRHLLPDDKMEEIAKLLADSVKWRLKIPAETGFNGVNENDDYTGNKDNNSDIIFLERIYREHGHEDK